MLIFVGLVCLVAYVAVLVRLDYLLGLGVIYGAEVGWTDLAEIYKEDTKSFLFLAYGPITRVMAVISMSIYLVFTKSSAIQFKEVI